MSGGDDPSLEQAALAVVRQASREARLVDAAAVARALGAVGFGQALEDDPQALAALLAAAPGIEAFAGLGGRTVYHDPRLLSRTYARILDRQGSPVVLMAEEIRLHSRDYPRPVPVELFEAPPFALAPEDIQAGLRAMAADPEYADITFTLSASGAVYLFSSRYLERAYATFLAEQAEAFAGNP